MLLWGAGGAAVPVGCIDRSTRTPAGLEKHAATRGRLALLSSIMSPVTLQQHRRFLVGFRCSKAMVAARVTRCRFPQDWNFEGSDSALMFI